MIFQLKKITFKIVDESFKICQMNRFQKITSSVTIKRKQLCVYVYIQADFKPVEKD